MSPTTRSVKLQLIHGLKMSKTAALDTHRLNLVDILRGGYSQGGGGRVPPSAPPPK